MDADGENIQITRAESTDIDEISLLSAKTSEYNAITRTMLTTKPRDFDLAARETFYRFWYTRALGDSKSSNVVFKATDAQGKVIGCFWLQWFHGHLRSWTVTGSTRLPFLKPLLSTLPACIRKEAYYELLVMIHQHRMDWMETTSHIPGQGYWYLKTLAFLPRSENDAEVAKQLISHAYAFDTDHGLFAHCTPESFCSLFRHFKWEFADDMPIDGIDYPNYYILKGLIRRAKSTVQISQLSEAEAVVADLENLFCGWSRDSCPFRSEEM